MQQIFLGEHIMRNDDQRRRSNEGRYSDQRSGKDYRSESSGGSWQTRPDADAPYDPGVPLFEGRQERRNQFERSNYGNMDDSGHRGGYDRQSPPWGQRDEEYGRGDRHSRETGYGGYSGEYGYGGESERFGGYSGGRSHGYGTGAGQGGQAGGFERGSPGRESYQRGSSFDDEYGRAYGESGFMGGRGRGAYQQRSPGTLPKGYQRSDERIREDICESLSYSGLDVSDVTVDVSNGQVSLSGTVKDRRDKHAIENCADRCLGVHDVDNRIRVSRDSGADQTGQQASGMSGSGATGGNQPSRGK